MIPKIIHFCWFGGNEYPDIVKKCLLSWEKNLPDYEIKIWNEKSFSVDECLFTKEAYVYKKWAFVSDYVRLYALEKFGGIYLDADVEVLKDFSYLLSEKEYVSSFVEGGLIATGFIAAKPHHSYVKELMKYYQDKHFINDNGSFETVMNPLIFTKVAINLYGFDMKKNFFENESICIYPLETFMPFRKNILGINSMKHNNFHITDKTCTIHYDMGSWIIPNPLTRMVKGIVRLLMPIKMYNNTKKRKNLKAIKRI